MCCEDTGTKKEIVGECHECDGNVDEDGVSDDICGYSPLICEECGKASCDYSC